MSAGVAWGNLDRWLARNRGPQALAIVFGGSCNGLSFLRSLGRRGVPTLLLESERYLGTFTRFGKVLMLPPVNAAPDLWEEVLAYVAARLDQPGVIFATSDELCLFVSQREAALKRHYRLLMPDATTMQQIVNKRSQYEIAQAAGIPVPAIHFPESPAAAARVAAAMTYPCLLKPYTSHTARKKLQGKVAVVQTAEELRAAYERITGKGITVMIQEIIPGADSELFGYMAFWDEAGREVTWVTKRKLRQFPPQFGDGSFQVTVDAPEVAELSRRLLRAFRYRGFVTVEFKRSARDQVCRLIEINPRTVSGNQLAICAGVDFPWLGYQHLTGASAGTVAPFRVGVKYVNEEWDVQAYRALHRAGQLDRRSWLRSLTGTEAWALGAWDDPRPLLAGGWRFLRKTFGA